MQPKKLTCEVCGYQGKQLHQHLTAVHKMTTESYRARYGKDRVMQVGFNPIKKTPNKAHSNRVKSSHKKAKHPAEELQPYSRLELYDLLLLGDRWKGYVGKTKYRTMLKQEPRLYHSIMEYTKAIPHKWILEQRMLYIVQYKFNIDPIKCVCGRRVTFSTYCRRCPDPKKTCKGHTAETRKKMRLSTIRYLNSIKGQLAPRYNRNSIALIEEFGEKHGLEFQHAENGGEFHIGELGYWVDAYDKVNNVVLEVDESHHFDTHGRLSIRDQQRQQEIESLLGCKFYRIKI